MAESFVEENFLKSGQEKTTYSFKHNLIVCKLHFRLVSIVSVPVEADSWDTRAVPSQLVTLVTYVKYLNSDLIINIWQKSSHGERKKRIMFNEFKEERRDIKLC